MQTVGHARSSSRLARLSSTRRGLLLGLALATAGGASLADGTPAWRAPDTAMLRQAVETNARALLVPGVVVVLRTPQGEQVLRWGTTSWRGSEPVDENQHVRVGSNTKTWVGTVILQQAQEGKLGLQDAVSRHWPGVPGGDNITIEQLLNMRSGLFNYSETAQLNGVLDAQPQKAWRPEELLDIAFKERPYFAPGAGFHYSNTNTVLLGLIAQKLDGGKPLPQVLRDRLFVPLGMKNTYFPELTQSVLASPRSRGYMFGTNRLTLTTPALPADMQAQARAGTLAPVERTDDNPSWGWAAGAGVSTARDLVTWVEALAGGKVLAEPMQRQRMASPRPIDPASAASAQYGWALAKFGPMYGHTGELPGYNSFMGHDPVNKVTLVVWTNLAPAADGHDPATTIAKALIGQIYAPAK